MYEFRHSQSNRLNQAKMAPIFECPTITGALVMTGILLADHHSLFRSGMVKLIDGIGGFALAAEVDTGGAAAEYVLSLIHI